jgi:hypothetical protein
MGVVERAAQIGPLRDPGYWRGEFMPESEDGREKPEVAREPEGLMPDLEPEVREAPDEPVDEDLAAATEDPALSLKEPDSE